MVARILDVTPDEYHSLPGLSSSTAATLIARSPLHAWTEHGAYGGMGKDPTASMDRGSVIHRLVLGRGAAYEVLSFGDFRTNAAKDARDAARAAGKIPILAHAFEDANVAAGKIRCGLAERGIVLDGASELAFEWEETSAVGPVLCRGMADHVWLDDGRILDLKVVENAAPSAVERSAENMGYAIQACAYTRAITALRPQLVGRVRFTFAFCEPEPPHAMNLSEPDGMFRELGERRWLRAYETWAACVRANAWPGYDGSGPNRISPPAWALSREEMA